MAGRVDSRARSSSRRKLRPQRSAVTAAMSPPSWRAAGRPPEAAEGQATLAAADRLIQLARSNPDASLQQHPVHARLGW